MESLVFSESLVKKISKILTENLIFSESLTKKTKKILTDSLSFLEALIREFKHRSISWTEHSDEDKDWEEREDPP